jgi:hypothetical protein
MPRKIDDPWGRAEILLGAMSRMDGTDSHVHEWPAAVIRDLRADIMHYCAKRNEGIKPEQVDYLDPEKIFQQAKKQFVLELTPLEAQRHVVANDNARGAQRPPEQTDAWTRAMMDPGFAKTATALDQRQLRETISLDTSHQKEVHRLGASDQLTQKHDLENIDLQKKFDAERMRYAREFLRGREIAEDLRREEKQRAMEHDAPELYH